MSSNLEYQPLEENGIRLITLLPSTSDSALVECQLFHSSLSAPQPSYVALSYTWDSRLDNDDNGSEEAQEIVLVNGHEVLVQKNLALALRCIRSDVPFCIWADALCINQSDTKERSSQVRLMREIFSYATNVWAWLGREAKDSNLAVDFLAHLARESDSEHIGDWLRNDALQPSFYPTWEALKCFLGRSWWKRAWIVQEFALAQEVTFLCGDRSLSVEDFEAADRLLFVHWSASKSSLVTTLRQNVDISARTFDPPRNLLRLRRRLRQGERISALESLQMTRYALATDPRDQLFAKLGLSGRELTDLCPPDYDLEPEDVWFTFLSTYIKKKKDLYIICLTGMLPRKFHSLPSWLPDWGPSRPSYVLCSTNETPEWPYFDAAGGTEPCVTIPDQRPKDGIRIICEGFEVDEVDGVAGDGWAEVPNLPHQSRSSKSVYETKLGAFEALCRTVTANTNRLGTWGPPPPEFKILFAKRWEELDSQVAQYESDPNSAKPFCLYPRASGFERAWRSMRNLLFAGASLRSIVNAGLWTNSEATLVLKSSQEESTEPIKASSHLLWTALEHSAGQACFERHVFTTVKGYLGIGPATTKPGDKISVLLGCRVPVLLRKELQQYHVIGEAYVDGIMYGESMKEAPAATTSRQTTDFELC